MFMIKFLSAISSVAFYFAVFHHTCGTPVFCRRKMTWNIICVMGCKSSFLTFSSFCVECFLTSWVLSVWGFVAVDLSIVRWLLSVLCFTITQLLCMLSFRYDAMLHILYMVCHVSFVGLFYVPNLIFSMHFNTGENMHKGECKKEVSITCYSELSFQLALAHCPASHLFCWQSSTTI
jgi:hypothetical protein